MFILLCHNCFSDLIFFEIILKALSNGSKIFELKVHSTIKVIAFLHAF